MLRTPLALLALAASTFAAPQDASRTPVSADRTAELEERYGSSPIDLAAADGDLYVLGPDGVPVEGAQVACAVLREGGVGTPSSALLEVVTTDARGLADLRHRDEVTDLLIWAEGLPTLLVGGERTTHDADGELLEHHRRLAGSGAFLVRLDEPEVLTGKVLVDGEPVGEGLELDLMSVFHINVWPQIDRELAKLLGHSSLRRRLFKTETDAEGRFRFAGFPRTIFRYGRRAGEAQPLRLQWADRELFPLGAAPEELELGWLNSLEVDGEAETVTLELTSVGWIEGRVVTPWGGDVGAGPVLRFTLQGHDHLRGILDDFELDAEGRFRIPVPRPFPVLDAILDPRLGPEVFGDFDAWKDWPTQALRVEPPPVQEGLVWDVGDLVCRLEGAGQILVRDTAGNPVPGARARILEPYQVPLVVDNPHLRWRDGELPRATDAQGRLNVRLPEPGHALEVTHPDFDGRLVTDLDPVEPFAKPIEVTLTRSAKLTVVAQLPPHLPPHRVLVQLQAAEPALRLGEDDRRDYRAVAEQAVTGPLAARLLDLDTGAAWSFTHQLQTFRCGATHPGGEVRLELPGIQPGVAFDLCVLEPTGGVFLEHRLGAFAVGEQRTVHVDLPAPLGPLSGRVVDAWERPVAKADVHFGALALSHVATTDEDGRFTIEGAYGTEGRVLVESAGRWSGCGGVGGGASGRIPQARMLVDSWTFEPGVEARIELPPSRYIELRIVEADGSPSAWSWTSGIFDASGRVFLGSAHPWGSLPENRHRLPLPGGIDVWLELTMGDVTHRRLVHADEEEVVVEVESFGRAHVDHGGPHPAASVDGYLLTHQESGRQRWRTEWSQPGPSDLGVLPAGAYSLQPCSSIDRGRTRTPIGPPVVFAVLPGETTVLSLP